MYILDRQSIKIIFQPSKILLSIFWAFLVFFFISYLLFTLFSGMPGQESHFTDYTAIDDDTAPIALDVADTVAFLFVQNTDASNAVYINIAAGTAAAAAGNIYLNAGESWYARLTTTLVGSVHAISSTSTVNCIVAALCDDVSV